MKTVKDKDMYWAIDERIDRVVEQLEDRKLKQEQNDWAYDDLKDWILKLNDMDKILLNRIEVLESKEDK